MGRTFLQHLGGEKIYSCGSCGTYLTNKENLISCRFRGSTGKALLFDKVVNLNVSEMQDRLMLTGRHLVRDIACKSCDAKLGWFYEYAVKSDQRYKEGKFILEYQLISESEGIPSDCYRVTYPSSASSASSSSSSGSNSNHSL